MNRGRLVVVHGLPPFGPSGSARADQFLLPLLCRGRRPSEQGRGWGLGPTAPDLGVCGGIPPRKIAVLGHAAEPDRREPVGQPTAPLTLKGNSEGKLQWKPPILRGWRGLQTGRGDHTIALSMPVFRAVQGRAPGVRQVWPNLRRKETNLKADIQGKRLQAGWKEDFQQAVLRR